MKTGGKQILCRLVIVVLSTASVSLYASSNNNPHIEDEMLLAMQDPDNDDDPPPPPPPPPDDPEDDVMTGPEPEGNRYKGHPFDLGASDIVEESTEFDEESGNFRRERRIDGIEVGDPEELSIDDYIDEDLRERRDAYFRERAEAQSTIDEERAFQDIDLGPQLLERFLDGDIVDVQPNISAELIFSGDFQRIQNPEWSVEQQRQRYFKFDQNIQMNVRATIGDRINFDLNYDTEASFDFDNQINLDYHGEEDDIIQTIEVGDVSMPLQSSLIKGSQSLFGIKSEMQFGNLTVTTLLSQQRSETENITIEDGAQTHEFDISATEYDANRHFFLSHYFRENYNDHMSNLPAINSQVRITRLDVWVTNRRAQTENTRNVVAFMDLAEPDPHNDFWDPVAGRTLPDNDANNMHDFLISDPRFRNNNRVSEALQGLAAQGVSNGRDYQRIENARKLSEDQYDFHPQLGYISLNRQLESDEVLAVAFEYTIGDQTFQVGDFSRDVPPESNEPKVLFLKKLKGISHRPSLPIWDLMMKNVYALGARNINREDFRLDVVYFDDESGSYMDFLPEPDEENLAGTQLIRVLGLDRLNRQQELRPDGLFDFIEGVTINSQTGRVIFPVLEPFGSDLRDQFQDRQRADDRYVFQEIYDSTKFVAEEMTENDHFFLRGHYRGEGGDEINIDAVNIPEGSVRVTAGGMPLQENVHYTVDYTLGRVRIIDESILNSGEAINVSVEKSDLFNVQQKSLVGTRLDYEFSENFNIGGTFLHLNERPIETRVKIGDEPLTNSIWGVDGSYTTESQLLTSLVDRLPFYESNVPSELSFEGEFAHLIPGESRSLGEGGVSYLDDFQASERGINLKHPNEWYFASTPQFQPDKFPNADKINDLSYNYERANMAWYIIDQVFHRNTNRTPSHIRDNVEMQSNHFMREVLQNEIFPDKQIPQGVPPNQQTLDLAFYPEERGVYNYNADALNEEGRFRNPENKWGGIMRALETTDFESANVQYVEFWMMDPFVYDENHSGGDFYINLGHISEDILRDGRKSFESGLPSSEEVKNVDTTVWGRVPTLPEAHKSFDNDPSARPFQDVGLDGLSTEDERSFFNDNFLEPIANQHGTNSRAYQEAFDDPSNDRFQFYLASEYSQQEASIVERYKRYNRPEGNTPTSDQWEGDIPEQGRNRPDGEDISGDFTMNELEAYYQYQISLRPQDMVVGENYITNVQEANVELRDGSTESVKWYQFKVPVRNYDERYGEVQDFRSVRFMRMFFHGFEDSVITRLGELKLVRGDWRPYTRDLERPGTTVTHDDIDPTSFDISTVSLEENASRRPIPYKMPPGIDRDVDPSSPYLTEQNERSLALNVCNLQEGDARAAYKRTSHDIRHHKRLRMFAHMEGRDDDVERGDVWLFVRLGTDQEQNYYEYEIPLDPTRHGARDARDIWPEANEIDLRLEDLTTAKRDRDNQNASLRVPFTRLDSEGRGRITVRGNPSLDNVRTIMIGVRNQKEEDNHLGNEDFFDDGSAHCVEVWVNELRVTGFDTEGGWAANVRGRAKLADLGEVTLSGNRETIGFGSIEETLQERNRKDRRGYNFTTQISFDRFFPDDLGLELPVYYSYSEDIARPKYNPLSPDVELDHTLEPIEESDRRDSVLEMTEEYESRRSLNFTNVRLAPSRERETRFYDIDNFSLTYAYSERFNRDIRVSRHRRINHRGALSYNYGFSPDPVRPFSFIGGGDWLNLLREFNFNYIPQSWAFNAELNRDFGELLYRNTSGIETAMEPSFNKNFTMRRQYNLNHDLTRNLRLSYDATANARIEEPPGPLDTDEKRQEVWENVRSLGTMENFLQTLNATYQVPLDRIPVTDWTNASLSYETSFNWQGAAPANQELGNIIENSRTIGLDGQLDFVNLYNKSQFLRTVNQNRSNVDRLQQERDRELQRMDDDEEPPPEINETRVVILERVSRVLMSLRDISVNYSTTEGTQLPGFVHEPQYLGNNFRQSAPGLPFVFGSQDDIRPQAANNDWLSTDTMQNNPFIKNYTDNLSAQAVIEPIRDFRINVDANRRFSRNIQEDFRADPHGEFQSFSPVERGNFSMSFIALPTAFDPLDSENFSEAYRQMEENRRVIAERRSEENPLSDQTDTTTGFPIGYGPGSQDVLLPAFLAAYSGRDPGDYTLNEFPSIPLPNWRINYTGLSRMDWVQSFARSIAINHAYRSSYNVSNYTSTINWDPETEPEHGENLRPEFQIAQATISEQFSPLIGLNITWINDWSTRLEYQRTRNIALNFDNYQMIESRDEDFIVGVGYRTSDLEIPFLIGGRRIVLENELNFRLDFTIRENVTISRTIDEDQATVTRGQMNMQINPEVSYMVNDNLTARLFLNRNVTEPAVSRQHPTSFTNFGLSLQYNLAL